jgi:hypothetical protein
LKGAYFAPRHKLKDIDYKHAKETQIMLDKFEVVKQLISSYTRNICEFFWIFKLVFPMRLVAVTAITVG